MCKQFPIFTRNEEQKIAFKSMAQSKGMTMVDLLDYLMGDTKEPPTNKDIIDLACDMLNQNADKSHVIRLLQTLS